MEDFCQYKFFKKARPALFRPPPYVRASEGINDRKKIPSLQLRANDPSKLLLLTETLKDTSSRALEVKINKHLLSEAKCQVVFLMSLLVVPFEAVVRVISSKIMAVHVQIPITEKLITSVISNGDGIQMACSQLHEKILDLVKSLVDVPTGEVFAYPVFEQTNETGVTQFTEKPVVLVFVLNSPLQRLFVSRLVQETFRFALPLLVNTQRCEEEERLRLQGQLVLAMNRQFIGGMEDFNQLLVDIVDNAKILTDSERGALYLLEPHRKFLIPYVFDGTKAAPDKVAKNKGVIGFVFTSGHVIYTNDAHNHMYFTPSDDERYGVTTKSFLCLPLRDEEEVIGVLQLSNKNAGEYTVFDKDAVEIFGLYAGLSILHAHNFKNVNDTKIRNKLSTELLVYHLKIRRTCIRHVMFAKRPHCPDFNSPQYNARDIPLHQSVLFAMRMYEDLNLIDTFKIERKILATFLLYIERGYKRRRYNNWMHAFTMAHFAYSVVYTFQIQRRRIMTDMEVLALITACFCHNVDHRGVTGPYYTCTLNSLFSSTGSVMETHHLVQALNVLNIEGCNFLVNLDPTCYSSFLGLFKEYILATNLAVHLNMLKKQELLLMRGFKHRNPEHRLLFTALVITCSDLCDQTRGWKVARMVAGEMHQDYYRTSDLETAMGRQPGVIMDRHKASIPELQYEFLRDTCLPPFKLLTKVFPELQFCLDSIHENMKRWELAKDHFLNRPAEHTTSLEMLKSDVLEFTEAQLMGPEEEEEHGSSSSDDY